MYQLNKYKSFKYFLEVKLSIIKILFCLDISCFTNWMVTVHASYILQMSTQMTMSFAWKTKVFI